MMDLKKKKKGKGTSLSRQIIALIVLGAVCLALVGTLITVNILTGIRKFEYGGETYYILRQKDDKGETCYIMTDKDRNPLEATKDGYFIVKDGTLIELDQKTGLADRYIPVDTEGNEQVGINDRVLIFPHTNKANVQSIEVYNGKGSFAFYRMRSYEDTDKVVYACILRSGEYYLVDTDGKEYTRGEDGLYTLKSGNKLAVDANTGIIYTHTYYDFDGKEYHIKKDSEGAYKLYDANGSEVTNRVSKTGELKDKDGKTYEAELYNYLVTAHGTLLKVDEKYGTLSIWSVQEYIEKSKSFDTYYFLYKGDKYVLCDSKGETIKYTAIDDADYYRTGGNAYIAFNEDNGSYSVRIKKNFYIIASNDGVYTLYNKKTPLGANGSGYFAIDEETYVSFDTASGSYSVLEFTGEGYEETDSKYLNATVNTDADGEFVIEGFEGTTYDPSLFTALIVSGGYTITAEGGKLSQPEKLYDANGNVMKNESGAEMIDFAAYGLIECERVDETGKTYTYKPAYYVLKDLEGNVHRLTIGDKIVSGAGYYIRYEQLGEDGKFTERQAVYILLDNYSTGYTQTYDIFYYYSISDTLLASVESIVTPLAVFPMSSNNYFDVEDFTFMVYNPQKSQDIILNDDPKDDDDYYDMLVRFSYEDVEERRNTAMSNFPYIMEEGCDLYGYTINSYSVDSCLMSLMDLKYVGVSHLGVDDQDLVKYGLDVAQYVIYFKHANMGYDSQMLLISALTPNDTYYVYSQLYDMIVEVERSSLNFLSWKSVDWLTTDFYDIGIGFGDNVKIEAGDYWANFDIAMSQTLTTNIKSTGSSNFTHTVFASDDRKTHILSIGAKVNANITGSATVTNLISVDFETLRDYYTYITGNKSTAGMTTEEIEKLNAFVETIYQHAEDDGQAMTLHSMTLRDTAGMSHEVNVYFIFSPNGEITVSVSVNKEALTLVFSMDAYLAYEKVMFSDKTLTPAEKTKAFDFYLAPSVSATAQNAFEQVIGTNSEGTTTIFTNGQIVKKYKDGRVVVDYALSNEYKVFFDVGDGDLIGIGRTWIRYYDMDDPETSKGGYKEITDKTYSFNSSLVRLIMPLDDGGNKVIKEGTLGSGNFNVTVTEDMVKVVDAEGNETRYLRYSGTSPFSSLYSTFLWASYEGYCDIPDEQKEAFKESEDSACQMKLTIDTKMGTQYVFRTYQYSERRAYITANGEGDFFVMRSFIDKIINTSKVVFEGTNVDPTDKY